MKRVVTAAILLTLVASMACAEEAQEQKYTVGIDADSVDQIAQTLERYVDGPLGIYYEGAVKVALFKAWGSLFALLLGSGVLLFSLTKHDWKASGVFDLKWLLVGALGFAVAFVGFVIAVNGAFVGLVSPEYVAIQDILQSLPR